MRALYVTTLGDTLIYGFYILSQLSEAVGVLNEIALKNISSDVYTFNILVDVQGRKAENCQKCVGYDDKRWCKTRRYLGCFELWWQLYNLYYLFIYSFIFW